VNSVQSLIVQARERLSAANGRRRAADFALNTARTGVQSAAETLEAAQEQSGQPLPVLPAARDEVGGLDPPRIDGVVQKTALVFTAELLKNSPHSRRAAD
jgi:hypothetical protein